MTTTEAAGTSARVGLVQIGVILLALATAGIHLYLFLIEGFLGDGSMLPIFQFLFVGNFLGYITLALALYFVAPLARFRPVIRALIISIAVASIFSYFDVNVIDTLGNVDKIIEVALIVLLAVDAFIAATKSEPARQ